MVLGGQIDRIPNALIKELCRVTKEVDKKFVEGVVFFGGSTIWRGIGLLTEST